MEWKHLRRLLYSSGAIALLGVLVALAALDRVNGATGRADSAFELGTSAISAGGGVEVRPRAADGLVDFERATSESRRATLVLGLAATLTPVLVFLNVMGFAGQYARSPDFERPYRVEEDGDLELPPRH